MLLIIKAKSSTGHPHDVRFELVEETLTVKCSCRAGIFGLLRTRGRDERDQGTRD